MRRLTTVILVLYSVIAFCQSDSPPAAKSRPMIITVPNCITVGVTAARYPSFEIGYSKFYIEERRFIGGSLTTSHVFLDAYRLGITPRFIYNVLGLQGGISIPIYTDLDGAFDVRISPEIGIGGGFWHLLYSPRIPTSNNKLSYISNHTINFALNFFWYKGNELK